MPQYLTNTAEDPTPPPAEAPSPAHRRRAVLRMVLLGVALAGAMAAVTFSPMRPWLADAERVRQALTALGIWVYPACALAVAVLVACGIPRLVFCAIGGMVLGFWWGLLLVQAGTLMGYYGIFLFVRWGGRTWTMQRWPKLHKWAGLIQQQGTMGVVLVRQLPIHGTLVNVCLGLSRVKHRHFLIGSLIGIFPEAIPTTLVGAGIVKGRLEHAAGYLAAAAIAFALIWIACTYALRRLRPSQPGATLLDEAASLEGALEGASE